MRDVCLDCPAAGARAGVRGVRGEVEGAGVLRGGAAVDVVAVLVVARDLFREARSIDPLCDGVDELVAGGEVRADCGSEGGGRGR